MVDSCLCLKNDNNVDCVFGNNNYILLPLYWMFSILPPPPRIGFIVVLCQKCQSLPSVLVEVELSRGSCVFVVWSSFVTIRWQHGNCLKI